MGLSITGILSLDCNLLNVRLRRVTWKNLRLRRMSNSFPIECLQESKAFELPQEILSHSQPLKRNIKEAFYEMSRQAFHIFTQDTFKPTWEETHLSKSRSDLITSCSTRSNAWKKRRMEMKTQERGKRLSQPERRPSGAPVLQPGNLEPRRHFNRTHRFLKDKKRNPYAWEIVRMGIRRCFYFFQKLTALLRKRMHSKN